VVKVCLAISGIRPDLPWSFVLLMLFFVIPLAYIFNQGISFLGNRVRNKSFGVLLISASSSIILLFLFHLLQKGLFIISFGYVAAYINYRREGKCSDLQTLLYGAVVIFIGFSVVCGMNYLLGSMTSGRVHDLQLMNLDLAIYGWLLNIDGSTGIYPLIHNGWAFQVLENAYRVLFLELFVVIFVILDNGENLSHFFRAFFSCYLLGLAIFFIYPAVGPFTYFPESFATAYEHTATFKMMHNVCTEYQNLIHGASHLTGFGYFVAVPSLHVAQAVLFQFFLLSSRPHFWAFLPANLILALSTFMLGFHYLIDVPAGFIVALVVILCFRFLKRRTIAQVSFC